MPEPRTSLTGTAERLAQHVLAFHHLRHTHPTAYQLVLEHGEPHPAPLGPTDLTGFERACFFNAGVVALAEPDRYSYAEGYAVAWHEWADGEAGPSPLLIHHGWLIERDTGHVVDPTWRERGWSYHGIEIPRECQLRWLPIRDDDVIDPEGNWSLLGEYFAVMLGDETVRVGFWS